MQAKRSEDYDYKLSKIIHQKNIAQCRPAVQAKITPATSRTLELTHARPHDRDLLPLQKHQISYDNHAIMHRIIQINDRQQTMLDRYDQYARYNQFQRPFRHKKPYRNQQQRLIELQNEKLYKSIIKMKPRIGELKQWNQEHSKNRSYSKIYSKHRSNQKRDTIKQKSEREIKQLQKYIKESLDFDQGDEQGKQVGLPPLKPTHK